MALKQKYTTDSGAIAFIRRSAAIAAIDPSVQASGNPVDPNFFVSVSDSRRAQGLKARSVTLARTDATGPSGVKAIQRVRVSCLTQAGYTALATGGAVTYKGKNDWLPVSQSSEG